MPTHSRRTNKKQTDLLTVLITLVSILSPLMALPQVYLIYSSRHAAGVSVITWIASIVTSGIWLWYGSVHKAKPIIVNSAIGGALSICIVIGVLLYP